MNIKRLILMNTADFRFRQHPSDYEFSSFSHLGLRTLQAALRQNGFQQTKIFPANRRVVRDVVENKTGIINGLKDLGAGERGTAIGISTTSDDYFKLPTLSAMIKKAFPGSFLIAGGPHFRREKTDQILSPIEVALQTNLADAVVAGHGQPLVDFITKNEATAGFYQLEPNSYKLSGSGYGRYPQLPAPPYIFEKQERALSSILDFNCFNNCGFCSVPSGGNFRFSEEASILGLRQASERLQPAQLALNDPNAYTPENYSYYFQIISEVRKELPRLAIVTANLDPSNLTLAAHREKLQDFFEKNLFWSYFLGRDSILAEDASLIETKHRGKIKDQEQLDQEGTALKAFINAVKLFSPRLAENPPRHFIISYIISPLQSKNSLMAMAEEMEELAALSDRHLTVAVRFSPLIPYPGTNVRAKLLDLLRNPYDYSLLNGFRNPWKEEIGPGYELIERLQEVYWQDGEPTTSPPVIAQNLRGLINKIY